MAKRKAAWRELIHTGKDKRFVRRGTGGTFKESDHVGRSLTKDRQQRRRPRSKVSREIGGDVSVRVLFKPTGLCWLAARHGRAVGSPVRVDARLQWPFWRLLNTDMTHGRDRHLLSMRATDPRVPET